MSYDVTFEYGPTTPEYPWEELRARNYTSNVSQMWSEALGENLGDLVERAQTNADLIEPLTRGIAAMHAKRDLFRSMEPANGWGDVDGAREYLVWMLRMATAVPHGHADVSR